MKVTIEVKVARRELEVRKLQAGYMTLAWCAVPVVVLAVVMGAVIADPAILTLFILILPIITLMGYFSFTREAGVYVKRREARWAYEDVQDEYAEEIMRDQKMNI